MRNETKIKLAFTIEEAEEIEQALRNCAFDACSQYQRFNELATKFDRELEALEARDTPFDEEEEQK